MEIGHLLDRRHLEIAVTLRATLPSSRFHFVRVWKRRAYDDVQRASRTELSFRRAFDARADALEIPRELAPGGTVGDFGKFLHNALVMI